MISGEQIGELIKNPKSVKKAQLEDIATLLEKHPYCSSLYIIQLIGLSKTSDISFEEKLKVAASHVADREQLHAWIESSPKQEKTVEPPIKSELAEEIKEEVKEVLSPIVEETIEEEIVKEKIEIAKEAEPSEQVIEEEEKVEAKEEIETSSLDAEIMSSVVEAALSKEIDEQTEEIEIAEAKKKALEKEEKAKQQIEEALALIEKRKAEEAEKAKKKAEKEAKKKEKKAKKKAEKALKKSEEKKEKEESKKKQPQVILDKPANMTFIEWLKYKQQIASGQAVEFGNESVESEESTTEVDVVFDLTEDAPVTDKENISKKDINDLLDKFIEGDPKLEPKGKDFFNPSENAKKSVEDSTDLVSETLAEIHVMQGNYEKAISAYKQLTILYPEKKAIFAARIEKIEEKLNN